MVHDFHVDELAVVLVLRTRGSALLSRPSRLLLWSTLVVAAGTLSIPFLGELSVVFGFVPLSPVLMASNFAIVTGYILATEAAKVWYFRRLEPSATR